MKSITCTVATLALCTGVVLAAPQKDFPIPGNTNFEYCDSQSANGPIQITNLSLEPEHPREGDDLKIIYEMTTSNDQYFPPGSQVHYSVKWHGSQGPRGAFDPCKAFDCPLDVPFKHEKMIKLPKKLPGHHYSGKLELKSPNGEVLGCIKGKLTIKND